MDGCSEHSDCSGNRKCINLFCGEEKYFRALEEITCKSDQFCQVKIRLLYFPKPSILFNLRICLLGIIAALTFEEVYKDGRVGIQTGGKNVAAIRLVQ